MTREPYSSFPDDFDRAALVPPAGKRPSSAPPVPVELLPVLTERIEENEIPAKTPDTAPDAAAKSLGVGTPESLCAHRPSPVEPQAPTASGRQKPAAPTAGSLAWSELSALIDSVVRQELAAFEVRLRDRLRQEVQAWWQENRHERF